MLTPAGSGLKHLEEIKVEGLEMPAVNQIEVRQTASSYLAVDVEPHYLKLHPFCQQKAIVEWCRKHNIVVQAYCPILRGKMDHPVIQDIASKVSNVIYSCPFPVYRFN